MAVTPSVSVALATHNGEAYIRPQIESILAQTRPVDEIVLGDDDSSDGTVELVRALVPGDGPRLTVLQHRPALGVAGNFAAIIAATSGDVVALCDQDDVWHPERVERMLPWFAHADLVCSDARLVDAAGQPLGGLLSDAVALSAAERQALQGGDAFTALARRSLVTGATAMVDGRLARHAPAIGEGWIHDEWLALLAAMAGGVRWLPQPLIDYRQHDTNVRGARRLTLAERLDSLRGADPALREREAERAASLAAAAADHRLGTPEQRRLLRERAAFHRGRAALPDAPARRAPVILRQWLRGRYAQHSSGTSMALRDLLSSRSGAGDAQGSKH